MEAAGVPDAVLGLLGSPDAGLRAAAEGLLRERFPLLLPEVCERASESGSSASSGDGASDSERSGSGSEGGSPEEGA